MSVNRSLLTYRLIWIVVLTISIFLIFSLKEYPEFVESYYSKSVYPAIRAIFHVLFNYIPFSVGDVLYVAAVIAIILSFIKLFRFIFQKKWERSYLLLLRMIINVQLGILMFYLFWGINYFRPPASARLNLPDVPYTSAELNAVTAMLIDSANTYRSLLGKTDLEVSDNEIIQSAVLATQLSESFSSTVKHSLLSGLMNYTATAGYFNPFTGESQINYKMPVFVKPFTACHEMAHQTGFNREDEANFTGFIVGIKSPNKLLKYSCYYLASQEFLRQSSRTDSVSFKQLKKRISPEVLGDFKTENDYWNTYSGQAGIMSSLLYDNYLKVNNQPEGLATYNRMIKLLMAYYRRNTLLSLADD